MAQNDKKIRCALYCRNHTSYDLCLWPKVFPKYFFQILIFGVNSGLKGRKMAQNDKKLSLSHSISQEAYIMAIFGTRVKWWHLQTFFSFFQNFDFPGCYGKRAKNDPKWQKILSLTPYVRSRTSYDFGFWYTRVKW